MCCSIGYSVRSWCWEYLTDEVGKGLKKMSGEEVQISHFSSSIRNLKVDSDGEGVKKKKESANSEIPVLGELRKWYNWIESPGMSFTLVVFNTFWSVKECKKDDILSWRDTFMLAFSSPRAESVATIIRCSHVAFYYLWGTTCHTSELKAKGVMWCFFAVEADFVPLCWTLRKLWLLEKYEVFSVLSHSVAHKKTKIIIKSSNG